MIAPYPRPDKAANQDIKDLARAIASELLHSLRGTTIIESASGQSDGVFQCGALTVDTLRHEATWNGNQIELKRREFALLAFLAQNSGRAFSREHLLELAWPSGSAAEMESDRTVDVHVRRLRVKLGKEAAQLIRTIVGIGYKLQANIGEST